MFKNEREWLRFYCNAKYSDGFAGRVMRKQYEAYLKQGGFKDVHEVLAHGRLGNED